MQFYPTLLRNDAAKPYSKGLSRSVLACALWTLPFVAERSGAQELGTLALARDGKALAPIVVRDSKGVAGFAAQELKTYLDRVTGTEFAIVKAATAGPRIFVGDCPEARAAGLDVDALARDGFYRAVKGDDLFLLGRDHGERWRVYLHDKKEHATLFAVYDLLEDVCGVRWFKAGPFGEVVPRKPTLSVKREVVQDEPVFVDRSLCQFGLHGYKYPDADKHETAGTKDRSLWGLRNRYETVLFAEGCHSTYYLKYEERFAEKHPDWFALKKNGDRAIKTPRGSYLCYSHPGTVDALIKDARAYLTGQPPASRGLKTWNKCGYGNEFMVDPHDSYIDCQCERCLELHNADPEQAYSEVIFATVAKVAEAVKDLKGKYVSTLAYGPKREPPKTVVLPENVRVRLCVRGPIHHVLPGSSAEQMQLIEAWSKRLKGDLVLWLYNNAGRPGGRVPGAAEVEPHAIAEFVRAARPYIKGAFFENESTAHTFRFLDEYVILKLMWDPDQDVDALLDDFFVNFFGAAAPQMERVYIRLAELWRRVFTIYGGDRPRYAGRIDMWEKIYTKEELAALAALADEAAELVRNNEALAWRVAMIRDNLIGQLQRNRADFERTLGVAKQTRTTCSRAHVVPAADGLLPLDAWEQAPHERLGDAPWRSKHAVDHGLTVLTHFKVLWTPDAFHLLIDAAEPDFANSATFAEREPDDRNLWKDSTVEVMITLHDERIMSQAKYQLLINDRGVLADMTVQLGKQDWGWDSGAKIVNERHDTGWRARVAIPFEALGIKDPVKLGPVAFNVVRHRARKGMEPELFSWSQAGWGDPSRHGRLTFSPEPSTPLPPNQLAGGGMDCSVKDRPYAPEGWLVPTASVPHVSIDAHERWDGAGAVKLELAEAGTVGLLQYMKGLKPDTRYRFRCKVRTANVVAQQQAGKWPRLNGVYANLFVPGANLHIPRQAMRGTTDWRNIEFEARTDKEFGEKPVFYVRLYLRNATGTAWFDDVEAREVRE